MKSNIVIRLDDRLIHGQVLVGWGSQFPLQRVIVANDEIAADTWEKELLMMAAPEDIETRIISLEQLAALYPELPEKSGLSMVLLKEPQDIAQLLVLGVAISHVNIGGLHFTPGRQKLLPYLFASNEEIKLFEQLIEKGIIFTCLDVPGGTGHDLSKLLGSVKKGPFSA